MRQLLTLFVAVVFALSLAGVAAAQGTQTAPSGSAPAAGGTQTDPSKPAASGSTAPSGSTMPSGSASGTDPSKSAADPSKSATDPSKSATGTSGAKPGMEKSATGKAGAKTAAGMRGQHRVMGEVTKVDAAKGAVTLKTDDGDLDLHFPPSALQGIKEGDRVEVQMAIRPAAGGAASKAGKAGKSTSSAGSGAAPAAKSGEQKPKTQ